MPYYHALNFSWGDHCSTMLKSRVCVSHTYGKHSTVMHTHTHTHTRCDTYLLFGESDELCLMGVVLELLVPALDTVTVLVEKCPMVMYKHIISIQYTAHNITVTLYNNMQSGSYSLAQRRTQY